MEAETKLRSIFELAPKPSDAVKAMIDGLEQLPNDQFRLDMGTYGSYGYRPVWGHVCFGCAATCALFQLGGRHPEEIGRAINDFDDRLLSLRISREDFDRYGYDFETAIDHFRGGRVDSLYRYYGVDADDPRIPWVAPDEAWGMSTLNWREELPKVKAYLARMIEAGL